MVVGLSSALLTLVATAPPPTTAAEPPPATMAPAPTTAPAPAPAVTKAPAPAPAVPREEPPSGLGFLIAGPVAVALGVPFSLLGSDAWRESCGPTNSDLECSGGTVRSVASHTVSFLAYGTGIALTAVGGQRYGRYAASRDAREHGRVHDHSGLVLTGAILLPVSLVGMVAARTLYWIPTPRCETESCVKTYQRSSTAVVAGFAIGASASAALMLYGASYTDWVRKNVRLSVAPSIGRGSGGLVLRGEF